MGSSRCRELSPFSGASVLTIAPFLFPAHQTGRAEFPHPAFRPTSSQGTRRRSSGQAFQTQQSAFSIDNVTGKAAGTAPCHLMSSHEEVAHPLIDVAIDTPVHPTIRSIREVTRPAEQRPVQRVAHFRPWIVIAENQKVANLRLEPLHTFLRWARAQIPLAVRPKVMGVKRVAEKVEAPGNSTLQGSQSPTAGLPSIAEEFFGVPVLRSW